MCTPPGSGKFSVYYEFLTSDATDTIARAIEGAGSWPDEPTVDALAKTLICRPVAAVCAGCGEIKRIPS